MDLAPADKETHASIHAYRDAVATATGVRFPNHETYGFHITLAYRLMEPPSGEAEEIASWVNEVDPTLHATFGIYDTGKPRFALFDDMVRFVGMDERATLRPR